MSCSSYSSVAPNPLQVGQAPRGLLKEKSWGVGVGAFPWPSGHSKWVVNERRTPAVGCRLSPATTRATASPSPSAKAVLRASARRRVVSGSDAASDGTWRRSTTINSSFAAVRSSVSRQFVEMFERAVLQNAHESLRAEAFDDLRVRHLFAEAERERDREAGAGFEREQAIGDGLDAVGSELAAAHRAMRVAGARPQQPQEIVDLGGGADGGSRRARGVLLFDRDGGREAVDEIDVGLLHALEELPRVRRQRLHVSPLPLGVDRVERERTLARSGGSRDHRDGAPGDVEVDPRRLCCRAPRMTKWDFMLKLNSRLRR